jgi:hypothetical protein
VFVAVTNNLAISYEQGLKVNKKGTTWLIGSIHSIGLIGSSNGYIDRNVAPIIAIFVNSGSNIDLRAASGAFNLEGYTARPAA